MAKIPEEAFRKAVFAVSSEMAEKFECLMTFNEVLALVSSKDPPRIRIDSRLVRPGDIFVAVKGTVCDGHDFIDQALAKGASCVVCQRPCPVRNPHRPGAGPPWEVASNGASPQNDSNIILVDDTAKAAALLAQAAMGNPASKLTNLAVTGTNGKTTVAFLVQSVIQNSGQKCGLVGTITYDTGSDSSQAGLTTPDCLAVAQMQEKMLRAGAKFMVIEASSHALAQDRLACVDFKAAAFTNLSGDHLDYHKTQSRYFAAKRILFERLSPDAVAVLNKESPYSNELAAKTKADILWYAVDMPADINAYIESMDITGTVFSLQYKGQRQKVHTPLLGRYNVSNHLAAAGLCLAAGFDLETIAGGLSALRTIPGRLEKLDATDPSVLIDYAHTDDALKNVLSTLRGLCRAKLTVVFGCGGDRDRTKRPRMAKVAEELADFVIVTSDNPRTEEPDDIISDIIGGFEKPNSQTIAIEPDREKAIGLAIGTAQQDDIVLIAGKGHETYQIIARQKIDFSDKAAALRCLGKRK